MSDGAGDTGLTVAKALTLIGDGKLNISRSTLVVVDEASMVGTPDLDKLLNYTTEGRAKIVLVGDAYQLSPVNARGGMFEELCAELPWSQRLTEVWRMADPEERDASLAIRALRGNRLRTAVKWYRDKGRLHSGDPIAMAADAFDAYLTDSAAGKDALLVCDTWEIADAINLRLHHKLAKVGPSLTVTRDQAVGVGDIIMTRRNDATVTVYPHNEHLGDKTDQVRNGNRWRVATIDLDTNRIAAERLSDGARAVFDGDYLKQHVTLGYATTVHSAQGVTADSCYAVLGEGSSRAMAYVAMTRGRHNNEAFLYQRLTDERDHEHSRLTFGQATHAARRSNKYSAAQHFRTILAIDDRPRTVHADAERAESQLLPDVVAEVRTRNRERCRARRASWRVHLRAAELWSDGHERMASAERASTADLDAGGLAL